MSINTLEPTSQIPKTNYMDNESLRTLTKHENLVSKNRTYKKDIKYNELAYISHDADADGLLSAVMMAEYLKDRTNIINGVENLKLNINVLGYNNEYVVSPKTETWFTPEASKNYGVYVFTDITPKHDWLKNLDSSQKVIIVDHHKSFYDEFQNMKSEITCDLLYVYNPQLSATYLTYDILNNAVALLDIFLFSETYLKFDEIASIRLNEVVFDSDDFQKLVELIDSFDVWKWYEHYLIDNTNILPYKAYFGLFNLFKSTTKNMCFSDVVDLFWNYIFTDIIDGNNTFLEEVLQCGDEFVETEKYHSDKKNYQIVENYEYFNDYSDHTFAIVLDQVDFWLVEKLSKKYDVDFVMFVKQKDIDSFKVSLRSNKAGINCIEIIREITNGNGGGHLLSVGGEISLIDYSNFITMTKNFYLTTK